jgi:hypothetical protein
METVSVTFTSLKNVSKEKAAKRRLVMMDSWKNQGGLTNYQTDRSSTLISIHSSSISKHMQSENLTNSKFENTKNAEDSDSRYDVISNVSDS